MRGHYLLRSWKTVCILQQMISADKNPHIFPPNKGYFLYLIGTLNMISSLEFPFFFAFVVVDVVIVSPCLDFGAIVEVVRINTLQQMLVSIRK